MTSGRLAKVSSWFWPRLFSNWLFQCFDPKCEILHAIINSRVSLSYIPPTVLFTCFLSFKLKCSEGLSSSIRPRLWSLLWLPEPLLLRGKSPQLWLCSDLWVTYPEVWVFTIPHLCPSYPSYSSCCGLYNISCIKSFLLVCRSFSSIKCFHLVWPIFCIL